MSRTILLADDSLTIQKVVELTFADTEYDVVSLSSGDDLLEKLDEVSPDLVICDIIMPGRDGYEVCQEIKSDPATLHIPVVLLSGTFEPFDRDRALAAGCSEIITKPFEARKLVETVENLLVGAVSDTAAVHEVPIAPPSGHPATSDPDMQTIESFPAYVEEPDAAAAEGLDLGEAVDSSLEFTDTGFAEMEEAARQSDRARDEVPEDGLDFEFSDEHEAFGTADSPELPEGAEFEPEFEAEVTVEPDTEIEPFAEPESTGDEEASDELREIPESERGAETAAPASDLEPTEPLLSELESSEEPSIGGTDSSEGTTGIGDVEPFAAVDSADDVAESAMTESDPFTSGGVDEVRDESYEISPETVEIPRTELPIDEPAEFVQVEEPTGDGEIVADVKYEREIEAEPDIEREFESHPPADAHPEEEPTTAPDADTGPVPAHMIPEGAQQPTEEPFGQPERERPRHLGELIELSDEDVDRIALRVLEIASDRFEQLAWEIVPDMAEIAVRQRIRELEAEIESSSEDESR